MNRLIIFFAIILALGIQPSWAASDVENRLFGPPPSSKSNPLIPKISKSETKTKKNSKSKTQSATSTKNSSTSSTTQKTPKLSQPQPAETTDVPTDKESLTDKIKQADEEISYDENSSQGSFIKDTWIEKLGSSISSKAEDSSDNIEIGSTRASLESLTMENRGNNRSNASVFDISGVMLRMSLSQAEAALLKRGFKLVSQKFEIPNFIKWRYEENCRNAGVVGYERLNNCVVKAAKETKHQYIESCKYVKLDSKEEINIWLTSNFTNNKIYKITYSTGITNINRGSGQKIQYLHNIKTYEFWRRINQKYGVPDNKTEVIWGMGNNKPYMKATTGKLLLEDPMLRELDYTRMSREDAKFMNTNLYNF